MKTAQEARTVLHSFLTETAMFKDTPNRALMWELFNYDVADHIATYTVPQYGDAPDDNATSFTEADIKANLSRYVARIGTGARGEEEAIRDLFKIADYACILWSKKMGLEEELAQIKKEQNENV